MTALSIAQRLGYISVVEELKVVTETTIASKHELITEERYKVIRSIEIVCFFL
jgi:ankyrin